MTKCTRHEDWSRRCAPPLAVALAVVMSARGAFTQEGSPPSAEAPTPAPREAPPAVRYDLGGPSFSIGGFERLAVGAGWNLGEYRVGGHHFFATAYGVALEGSAPDALLLRPYARLYGGSAGLLLGASGTVSTRFEGLSGGLGTEVGLGFGPVNLIYRYNFHLDPALRGHELLLVLYAGLSRR